MNMVYKLWRFYGIVRDNGKKGDRIFSKGFMRMVDPPWLTGKGIQVRCNEMVVQVGFCSKGKDLSEDEGILDALEGRLMEDQPKDIGNWP